MKTLRRWFFNLADTEKWLQQQKGWKLVAVKGLFFIFEESDIEYQYEFVYFQKNKNELERIYFDGWVFFYGS